VWGVVERELLGEMGVTLCMTDDVKPVLGPDEMASMSPQARADAVQAAIVRSWDEVPEPFRSEVLDLAATLGEQRRQRG
jgi:hypothetical protein